MAASVTSAAVKAESTTLSLPMLGAVPSMKEPCKLDSGWLLGVVARAIDRTMARKEAAYFLGIGESQLSKQLAGDGHLSMLRLGALPAEFWPVLIDELRAERHLDDRADRVRVATELIARGLASLIAEATR